MDSTNTVADNATSVQLSKDKDVVLINCGNAIATFEWRPGYDGAHRLAVEAVEVDGSTRHCVVSSATIGNSRKLLVACDDEDAAVTLLQRIGSAVAEAMGVTSRSNEDSFVNQPSARGSRLGEALGWSIAFVGICALIFALPVCFRLGMKATDWLFPHPTIAPPLLLPQSAPIPLTPPLALAPPVGPLAPATAPRMLTDSNASKR